MHSWQHTLKEPASASTTALAEDGITLEIRKVRNIFLDWLFKKLTSEIFQSVKNDQTGHTLEPLVDDAVLAKNLIAFCREDNPLDTLEETCSLLLKTETYP